MPFILVVGLTAAACTATAIPLDTCVTTYTALSSPISSMPPSTTPTTTLAKHRIQVRLVDGVGEFYDTAIGERFVPRGMNYNRFLTSVNGDRNDNVLGTTGYDPATIEADFSAMQALGFNAIRIMLETCGFHANDCITNASDRLNPAVVPLYVDYWVSAIRALTEAVAPLGAILAYELRQEHHFH